MFRSLTMSRDVLVLFVFLCVAMENVQVPGDLLVFFLSFFLCLYPTDNDAYTQPSRKNNNNNERFLHVRVFSLPTADSRTVEGRRDV